MWRSSRDKSSSLIQYQEEATCLWFLFFSYSSCCEKAQHVLPVILLLRLQLHQSIRIIGATGNRVTRQGSPCRPQTAKGNQPGSAKRPSLSRRPDPEKQIGYRTWWYVNMCDLTVHSQHKENMTLFSLGILGPIFGICCSRWIWHGPNGQDKSKISCRKSKDEYEEIRILLRLQLSCQQRSIGVNNDAVLWFKSHHFVL